MAKDDPWKGLSLPAVVLEVTAKRNTLQVDPSWPPTIAAIMKEAWEYEPEARPTFPDIMVPLRPLSDISPLMQSYLGLSLTD